MKLSKDVIRFVFVTDSHGDLIDPTASEVFSSFCRDFKPDLVIHGGDAHDFRFARQGVSSDDRDSTDGLKSDLEEAEKFLSTVYRFGKVRVFHMGNHDARLERLARRHSSGFIRESASKVLERIYSRLRKLKARVFPYSSNPSRGIFRLGRLLSCHGFATGVNALRKHAETYCAGNGVILIGHIHRDGFDRVSATSVVDSLEPGAASLGAECYSAGTLMDLGRPDFAEYADHRIATIGWSQSFLAGFVNQLTGEVFVFRIKKVSGVWRVPSIFSEMKSSR
jgi:predicted phosphodiesterase